MDTDDVLFNNDVGIFSLIAPALTVRGITEIDGGSAALTTFGMICMAVGFLDNCVRVKAMGIGEFDFSCGLPVRLIGLILLANVIVRFVVSLVTGTRFAVTVNALLLLICCTAFVAASTFIVCGFLMIVAMGCELVLFSCIGVVTAVFGRI